MWVLPIPLVVTKIIHLSPRMEWWSIGINKLDPHTNEVLKTYSSQVEVTTKYGMTRRTLRSAIKGNIVQRRFKWSYAS